MQKLSFFVLGVLVRAAVIQKDKELGNSKVKGFDALMGCFFRRTQIEGYHKHILCIKHQVSRERLTSSENGVSCFD